MSNIPADIKFEDRDEYNRKPIADRVFSLLTSNTDVSPIIVDGNWGVGKTEFCLKLNNMICSTQTSFKPIYIDAYKADHAAEPLMTLISEILKILPDEEAKNSLTKMAIPTLRFGTKTILKAGVGWLLRQDVGSLEEDVAKEIRDASSSAIDSAVELALNDHIRANEHIESLKKSLSAAVEKHPIIFLIDELDRCRPNFSVDLLENIKHIFDIKGVQFVLFTNLQQLKASIKHCYGTDIQAERYLDKFIGFKFSLPEHYQENQAQPLSASWTHFKSQLASSSSLSDSSLQSQGYMDLFKKLVHTNRHSLRETETFVRHLEIYQTLTDGNGFNKDIKFGYGLLRIIGVYLFVFDAETANSFSFDTVPAEKIGSYFGESNTRDLRGQPNQNPNTMEILFAIIALESTSRQTIQSFEAAALSEWEVHIHTFFDTRRGIDSRTKIILQAIDTLKLKTC